MFSDSGITKGDAFWRNEINDTISQIAKQQTLLSRCKQKLQDIPQQLYTDKKQYEKLCNIDHPLQYAYTQNYLELKKQFGKKLIPKLRFLVQLSDYVEINCEKYRQKLTTYQNLYSGQLWENQLKDFEVYKNSRSFTLVNQYNQKIPDLTDRQISSIFLLSKFIKPMNKDNFDLTDAYLVTEQTYHYILLLLDDYKQITQVLLQLLQTVDHYLDGSKLTKESKFEAIRSFKMDLPKMVLQFLTQSSVGKMSWFNQRNKSQMPDAEPLSHNTMKSTFH